MSYDYNECSGCGLMFRKADEQEQFETHDCDSDPALYLSTEEEDA
jgi:hypothetical protein